MIMREKNRVFIGLVSIMMLLSLVLSCDDLGKAENPKEQPAEPVATVAETPVISDLASRNYAQNAAAAALSLNAKVSSETASLSYKWYKNTTLSTAGGTLIENVNDSSYTPSTAELGDTYYYIVVTNTDSAKTTPTATNTSNVARIRVTSDAAGTPAATIAVDSATKYQYIRGFGGMSNAWTSPALSMPEVDRLFGPNGLGLNIFRIMIYPYMKDLFNGVEEAPTNDLSAHQNYYNMVRRAKKHGALILASPWTPPGEWKTNGSRLTGKLKPEHYSDYARHLKNYIKLMADNGAPIDYISTQNEPDIAVSYDGCEWTGEEMRDFIKEYGRYIAPANGTVQLAPGESYQFRDAYYNPMYNDPEAMAATDVIAGHIYGGGLRRHDKAIAAGKEVWMTEHLFNTSSNYPIDSQWQSVWTFIEDVHKCMINDFNAYVWWYSKRFYSLIGDGENQTVEGMLLFRGYALSHYAKYATGKTRVNATMTGGNPNVFLTTYESDNEITLVMYNQGNTPVGQLNITIPVEAKGASMVITQGGSDTQNDTTAESVKAMAPEIVVLSADGKTGAIDLPGSCIISVRFTK